MSTGLGVFDATIQDTNLWLKGLTAELGDCERQEGYAALRAVLHALRDRLQAHAAVNLAAQLPMLLRGLYYEGWTMPEKPSSEYSVNEFGDAVAAYLPPRFRFDPITTARAVFVIVASFMSEGEVGKVKSQLPPPLRALWPAGAMV